MTDTIKLQRTIKDEMFPRIYEMTGGTFDEMLAAVKALETRKWNPSSKTWKINATGLEALREQGYSIQEQEPLGYIYHPGYEKDLQTVYPINTPADYFGRVEFIIHFERRSSSGDYISTKPFGNKVIVFEVTEEEIAAENEAHKALVIESGFLDAEKMTFDRGNAIGRITRRKAKEVGDAIVGRFAELRGGKMDKETLTMAFKTINEEHGLFNKVGA